MNNESLTFYEELKNLRATAEIIDKVTKRINHAEEALTKNAFGLETEIHIAPGVILAWKKELKPEQKRPNFRIMLEEGDYKKALRETNITTRLKYYKYLTILVREVSNTFRELMQGVELDSDPYEGFEDFESKLEDRILSGEEDEQ